MLANPQTKTLKTVLEFFKRSISPETLLEDKSMTNYFRLIKNFKI